MTRQEWQQQFAKHLIDTTDCPEHFAMKCAADYAKEMEEEAQVGIQAGLRWEMKWQDPIWYANEEMSTWSDEQ